MIYISKNARPYAQAIFALAKMQKQLPVWVEVLSFLGNLVQNTQILTLVSDPRFKKDQFDQLIQNSYKNNLPNSCLALMHLLLVRKQWALLPQIAMLLDKMIKKDANILPIQVVTAQPLSEAQQGQLGKMLSLKTRKHVVIEPKVSPEIISGIILREEDNVFDASIKGILQRLEDKLKNNTTT